MDEKLFGAQVRHFLGSKERANIFKEIVYIYKKKIPCIFQIRRKMLAFFRQIAYFCKKKADDYCQSHL
jgi:hypothetical protein